MEIGFVEQLIGILERSALSELEYTEDGGRVRLVRSGSLAEPVAFPGLATPVQRAAAPAAATLPTAPTALTAPTVHTVAAPLSGLFYGSPAPGQPPFVALGDLVEAGQQLAIIEAMKMLNAVEADHCGRIVRIAATDGASVDAGAPLFEIEPAGDGDA